MAQKRITSHVRTHRKKSGLSQFDLARLLGYDNVGPVSRHERGVSIPPLAIALAYEAIFCVPVSELFPTVHEAIGRNVEARFRDLESTLGQKSAKDRDANATATKLQFIWARKTGVEL